MTPTTVKSAVLSLSLVLPLLAPAAVPAAEAETDGVAETIAAEMMGALGGREAYDASRLIRFDFAGRRSHQWDKHTGRHRVEGQTREGERYLVIHDLDDRRGRAWVDGMEVTGERAAELLENAYAAWVNDTYWLLMPYKLRDPGVVLTFEGQREMDGTTYDVLKLTFHEVGLTPGDTYWAYVHPETRLMEHWAYRLQSMAEDAEPTVWHWQGWQWYGDGAARVRLAPKRVMEGGERVLDLSPIEVSSSVPEGVFEGP